MKKRATKVAAESQAWCCFILFYASRQKKTSFYYWPKQFLKADPSMVLLAAKKQAEMHE